MSMEPEVVRVTGETTKKYREPSTQDTPVVRVSEAAMEPSTAELLEQERLDKSMRGEEAIDGLDEMRADAREEEEWTWSGKAGILRSSSSLRRRMEASGDQEVHP